MKTSPTTPIRVALDHWTPEFDPGLPPVANVAGGGTVIVETQCCSRGAVRQRLSTNPETFRAELGWTPGMPVTGPIAVPEAQVGDTLVVEILDIQVGEYGWTMAAKDRGAIGDLLETAESRILPVEDGHVIFEDRIRIPMHPMIGSIGTTPADAPLNTGWPGPHGGNLDCKLIAAGATLYLPVLVPGAHLALGDLHAVQGDGEVSCGGIEIAGEVTLQLGLLRGHEFPLPMLENDEMIAVIYSDETLDLAAKHAVERMTLFVAEHSDLSVADAGMVISQVGDIRICQMVDPLMTCRMEVPKWFLPELGIDLEAIWAEYRLA